MYATLRVSTIVTIGAFALAGCAGTDLFGTSNASDVTTASVAQTQAQRVDPACGNLALEIDTLRREGVADKIEKAAAKKYKMKPVDLTKASQLNRANAEFQTTCSTLPRAAASPTPAAAPAPAAKAPAKSAAAPAAAATVASVR